MALVILLVLTIIGVTALGTTTLEEKMAASSQEASRSFEAAESGLNKAINAASALDLHEAQTNTYSFDSGRSGSATVVTAFTAFSPPKRDSGYSAINYDSASFDQTSTGTASAGATTVLHQGVSQIVNKSD